MDEELALREAYRARFRERRWKRRAEALAYLGGKCIQCGETERLEFDHIDRSSKAYNICQLLASSRQKLFAELDKCQLLCTDCHRLKTGSEIPLPDHGTYNRYCKYRCRCDQCKEGAKAVRAKYQGRYPWQKTPARQRLGDSAYSEGFLKSF